MPNPTLILPGYSPHNKEWVDDVAKVLKENNIKPIKHYWLHWASIRTYSFNKELPILLKEINYDKINIIAKSVGVMAAFKLIPKISGKVEKLILCGVASVAANDRKDLLRKVLEIIPTKNILCIQNVKDKYVHFSNAKKFYHSVDKGLKIISKPRSDHNYPFFDDFLDFLD